jgi:2-dehydropantoate 2-reductase
MNVAILGAGALGSVIGAWFHRNGHPVTLWTTNVEHVDTINRNGLSFEFDGETQTLPIPASLPAAGLPPVELIVLLTKTLSSEAAIASVADQFTRGAYLLSLQNGIGNATTLSQWVNPDQIIYGCTMLPGRLIAPGQVASPGGGDTVFKSMTPAGLAFAKSIALSVPNSSFEFDANTDQIIWQKAAFNCAMNAISALGECTVSGIAQSDEATALAHAAAREVVAVASANSIPVNASAVADQIDFALANHGPHKPSMLQDIEKGRRTEIDSLCGAVQNIAEQLQVNAPINTALNALIQLKTVHFK